MTDKDFQSLFNQFNTTGTFLDGKKTGSGHIHTTFLIRTIEEDEQDYIIQNINDKVFPHVKEMMDNIIKVTEHIKNQQNRPDKTQVLEVIRTKSGKSFFTDSSGTHWRMYGKVSPGLSYDIVPNPNVAYEAGKAFGQFIVDLEDLPAEEIFPVIPNFHNMAVRYENFKSALAEDIVSRVKEVKTEVDFVEDQIERMLLIPELEKSGKLPVRITHNDTKLNNILFDKNDRAACVIDLDTVMPGLSLYDFGDTIRTAANTGEEDEAELDKVKFNIQVFEAFTKGFLKRTNTTLNSYELDNLSLSAQYMTFIMGLRFLTDYISGDVYYSTHYEKQNLRRCRAQFRLMQEMINHYDLSQKIVYNIAEKLKNDSV